MGLGSIFGPNSRFGAVSGGGFAHWVRSHSLNSFVYQRVLRCGFSTFLKTALRLCRLEVIVALPELRVCDGGHWLGVMKNLREDNKLFRIPRQIEFDLRANAA
jgi:hypothetical protein